MLIQSIKFWLEASQFNKKEANTLSYSTLDKHRLGGVAHLDFSVADGGGVDLLLLNGHVAERDVAFRRPDDGDAERRLEAWLVDAGEGATRVRRLELGRRDRDLLLSRVGVHALVEPDDAAGQVATET